MSSLGPNEAEFAQDLARIADNDPRFTRVDFRAWGIGDEGAGRLVVALGGNTVVTHLWLANNGISAPLVTALVGVLENITTLESLDLSQNNFCTEGARAAARLLHNTSSLEFLYLQNCGISVEGARILARALPSNFENIATLEALDLRGNNFGAEGARAVARLIRNTSSLWRLFLQNCGIGVEGARALTGPLLNNSTLTELNLMGNEIGDAGASFLAGFLAGNTTLTWIELERNGISDVGATSLAESLLNNSSLVTLGLEENDITVVGARLLTKALLVNCTVTGIFLAQEDLSEELRQLGDDLAQINASASSPQEALGLKIEWLRNLDEGDLSLLGFNESIVEEEVRRLGIACRVGWLISSGLDGEKEDAVTLVLDQLNHFMQAEQRLGLFRQLLGSPERGADVAASVDVATARTLYRYVADCGAAPAVIMCLMRAHPSLCACRDVRHCLFPFMLLATMVEAEVEDVLELLLLNPTLVESGIGRPVEHCIYL